MSLLGAGLGLLLASRREAPGVPSARRALARAADVAEVQFNGGRGTHALLAWTLLVGGLALAAWVVGLFLAALGGLFAVFLLWHVLRWRPTQQAFDRVRWLLAEGQLDRAREALEDWPAPIDGEALLPEPARVPGIPAIPSDERDALAIADAAIGRAATDLLRDVYAPLFWFALLPGGAGAVLVRVAGAAAVRWAGAPEARVRDTFGEWALLALDRVESVPARITAALAAIGGDTGATAEAWRATPPTVVGGRLAGARPLLVACALGALGHAREPVASDRCAQAVARMDAAGRLQWRVLVGWLLLMLLPGLVS